MDAVIYTRISQDRAGRELGVQRQEKDCRGLAINRGWNITERVFCDNDVSASGGRKRPEFEQMVDLIREGNVDAIIAYHVDRLYRRLPDLELLVTLVEQTKVQIATVAAGDFDLNTASGRMVARMLGAAAQGEVERMSERIRGKEAERAAAGKLHGGGRRPFGYDRSRDENGKVIPGSDYIVVPDEAKVITDAYDHILNGGSLTAYVVGLNERGLGTASGKRWSVTNFSETLKAPLIAGVRVHRGVSIKGTWEPLVSREDQETLVRILASRKVGGSYAGKSGSRTKYLLSGLLTCGVCGARLYKDSQKNRYVDGRSGGGFNCVSINASDAEFYVWSKAEREHLNKRPRKSAKVSEDSDARRSLVAQHVTMMERRDLMSAKYGVGDLGEREYNVATHAIDVEIQKIEQELQQLPTEARISPRRLMGQDVPLIERFEFLASVIKSAVVNPEGFEPRITITWT